MLYHPAGGIIEFPGIRKSKYTKDFSWGFYCTNNFKQAQKCARRNKQSPTINYYTYIENNDLKILKFEEMNDEWLDFIAKFKYPTHKISFHTLKALDCLNFERGEIINRI